MLGERSKERLRRVDMAKDAESATISIVVVSHNYERFLAKAVESALAQTHHLTEVIVVDDGSTDDSRAVIGRYRDRVVTVLKENGGQASAFNAGFKHASGSAVI